MTEPGPRKPDYPSGEQEGAPEQRSPQAPPTSAAEAAGTGGVGRVDDQTATPPQGDEARGAAYDLGGDQGSDTGDEPQSPSGT